MLKTSQSKLDIKSSEFFGGKTERGRVGSLGIRNEDLTQLTYQNGEFDIAVCLEVLEHVPEYGKALSEIYRVLKESGTAIITVPFLWDKYETLVRAKIDTISSKCSAHIRPRARSKLHHRQRGYVPQHSRALNPCIPRRSISQ